MSIPPGSSEVRQITLTLMVSPILLRDISSLALPALVLSSELIGGWVVGSLLPAQVDDSRCHRLEG